MIPNIHTNPFDYLSSFGWEPAAYNHFIFLQQAPGEDYFFKQTAMRNLGNSQNYHLKSARFPQQTSLIGMLRYQILKQNKKIDDAGKKLDGTGWDELIGNKGADASLFGKIRSISPCFLVDEHQLEPFIFLSKYAKDLPAASKETSDAVAGRTFDLNQVTPYEYKKDQGHLLIEDEFNAKNSFKDVFIGLKHQKTINADVIFHNVTRDHNQKSLRGTGLEQGRFKTNRYRLEEGFGFGFFAHVEEEHLTNDFVSVGGKNSRWKMQVFSKNQMADLTATTNGFILNQGNGIPDYDRYLFLSDSFIKEDYGGADKGIYLIANTMTFRHFVKLKSNGERKYASMPKFNPFAQVVEKGGWLFVPKGMDVRHLFQFPNQEESDNANFYKTIGFNQLMKI